MAEYTYDFHAMYSYLKKVTIQLTAEIISLNSQRDALIERVESLQSQLYYIDDDGNQQINTAVQQQIDETNKAITEIENRVAQLNNCIESSGAMIDAIIDTMSKIDDNYKQALDEIMERLDTYTDHINGYLRRLDDGPLSNDGAILYKPLSEIRALLDRNGKGVKAISDAAIREVQRRVVFDRFLSVDPSIEGLKPDEIRSKIDSLINDVASSPGVAAVMYYTLEKKEYLSGVDFENQAVKDIIDQVTNFQKYLGGNFPIIIGQKDVYLGGNQGWWGDDEIFGKSFLDYTKELGGCGPVAAANILANLALKNPDIAKKLGLGSLNQSRIATQAEYLNFMTDVYNTVTPLEVPIYRDKYDKESKIPSNFGVWFGMYLQRDILQYAYNKEVYLKGTTLDKFFAGPYDLKKLDSALTSGNSIAFGNLLTPVPLYKTDGTIYYDGYNLHWVNIIGKDEDKIFVSSWGQNYYIKYSELKDVSQINIAGGLNSMTYFEECDKIQTEAILKPS